MTNAETSSNPNLSVLIIDDEENMRHMLSKMLAHEGYAVEVAGDGQEGLNKLSTGSYDFILCDIKMPKMDGMAFLEAARELTRDTTIIMMSAYGTIDLAVQAMQLGAYDFISKPFKSDEVQLTIKKAEERNRLKNENLQLKVQIQRIQNKHQFGNLVAKSEPMQAVFALAAKSAQYKTTILITGESGTGKELVANAIHFASPRQDEPMVPVNCGSIPDNLLESELFGYVKGAFTGADTTKKGLFEEADGGTIFLDEIGELPLALQVKLLRVLQESEIRPVGAAKDKKVDVRVIAATSRDLTKMVSENNFREDLFYRLNVLPIEIPPLRDRNEDIPLLSKLFIGRFNKAFDRQVKGIAPEAMSYLLQHQWPGNVRELENIIERAMVLSEGDRLLLDHFSINSGAPSGKQRSGPLFEGYSIKKAQKILEKEMIVKALNATEGNRTHAARLLEISHPSLLSKMKAYEIDL